MRKKYKWKINARSIILPFFYLRSHGTYNIVGGFGVLRFENLGGSIRKARKLILSSSKNLSIVKTAWSINLGKMHSQTAILEYGTKTCRIYDPIKLKAWKLFTEFGKTGKLPKP